MKQRMLALLGRAAWIVPALFAGFVTVSTASQAARPELGVWYDDSGQGAVEIHICTDNANRLCGRIVWLKDQYAGLGERKGIAVPAAYAHMTSAAVEIRKLSVYDQLLEVVSNG